MSDSADIISAIFAEANQDADVKAVASALQKAYENGQWNPEYLTRAMLACAEASK